MKHTPEGKSVMEQVFTLQPKYIGKNFNQYKELKFIKPTDILVSEKTAEHIKQIFAGKLLEKIKNKTKMINLVNQPDFTQKLITELQNKIIQGRIININLIAGDLPMSDSLLLINTEFDFQNVINGFNRQTDITIECRYSAEKKKLMLKTVKRTFRV